VSAPGFAPSFILRSAFVWPAPFSLGTSSAFAFLALAHLRAVSHPGAQFLQFGGRYALAAYRTQATTTWRCCAALFALLFLSLAAQVVLPNYSVKRTAECRDGVSCCAPRRGRLPRVLGIHGHGSRIRSQYPSICRPVRSVGSFSSRTEMVANQRHGFYCRRLHARFRRISSVSDLAQPKRMDSVEPCNFSRC